MFRLIAFLLFGAAAGYVGYNVGRSGMIDLTKKYVISRIIGNGNAGGVQIVEYLVIDTNGNISFTGDESLATQLFYADAKRAADFVAMSFRNKVEVKALT